MNEFLTVGKIVKPQGICGELKVITYTDTSAVLKQFDRVYIEGIEYKLLKVRPQDNDCAFIMISGIADRNAAELLREKEVKVLRADAPALPKDTYYIADIVGCTAVDDGGKVLGTVKDITPARTDIYEIAKEDGSTLTFPAVSGVIENIDIDGKKITLNRKRLAEVSLEGK